MAMLGHVVPARLHAAPVRPAALVDRLRMDRQQGEADFGREGLSVASYLAVGFVAALAVVVVNSYSGESFGLCNSVLRGGPAVADFDPKQGQAGQGNRRSRGERGFSRGLGSDRNSRSGRT